MLKSEKQKKKTEEEDENAESHDNESKQADDAIETAKEKNKKTDEEETVESKEENRDDARERETEDGESPTATTKRKRKPLLIGIVAFVIVASALATILVLVVFNKPIKQRRQEIVEFLMSKQIIASGSQLDDPESPQAKAVEFLASEDFDNEALSDEKLVERYTMTVWYYATNGPKWQQQMGFLSNEDTCEWFSNVPLFDDGPTFKKGVICDTPEGSSDTLPVSSSDTPSVIRSLNMPSNLLQGTLLEGSIPSELQFLSNSLEQMNLGYNPGLEGDIPIALSELTKLWTLELQYCGITGTLPEWLGTKLPLRRLALSNNLLTGSIPTNLLQQTDLQVLALDDNGLTGNIGDFGPLTKIQYLYMEDNLMQGQLTNALLANWTAMKEMDFSRNEISGSLPSDLFTKMTNLKVLDLHGNDITGPLPNTVGDNNRIQVLALHDNRLIGRIPVDISNMTNLRHLDLSRNEISGNIPQQLGQLSGLFYLFLGSNSYDAQELPEELAQLTQLRELSIKKANLQGEHRFGWPPLLDWSCWSWIKIICKDQFPRNWVTP
mmetsp:Transcript_17796/g.43933  ORF Transcript_17796/g.43933 Transcript_17796/m.43933 type:complete len:551 (+) Transcript_17796:83-1735(+)